MTARDRILVILGMHRGGTSFLAHSVEALGFSLPQDRSGPSPDNPQGKFEPLSVVGLNEGALQRKGGWWCRIAPIDARPDPAEIQAALTTSYGDAARIVIKDPRLSLLMPGWRPVLEQLGPLCALIALRHPGETATSLARRDGIGADIAYLSWAAHLLAALETTEGLPRGLVLFPDWIDEPDATLARIAALADVAVPEGAAEAVSARFQHAAVHGGAQLNASLSDIDLLAGDLFELLARHARDGSTPSAAEIAPFRARFDVVSTPLREVELAATLRLAAQQDAIAALTADSDQLRAQAARAAEDGQKLQDQIAAIATEGADVIAALETRIAATEGQRDDLSARLARQVDAAEALEIRARNAEQQRDAARAENARLGQQLHETRTRMGAAQTDLAQSRARFDDALRAQNQQLGQLTQLLDRERMTVLKPIYRRLHRMGGRLLHGIRPNAAERARRTEPQPGHEPTDPPPRPPLTDPHGFAALPAADPEKPDIFVLPGIDWDAGIRRPQHLATELARAGHRVFYIEMAGDAGDGTTREVAPNLHVLRLPSRGLAPAPSGGIPAASQRAWIEHFHAFADLVQVTPRAHVVIGHPDWWNFARHLSSQFQLTVDVTDDLARAPTPALLDAEAKMIAGADRVIVASQDLHDRHAPRRPVRLVRNGADIGHFTRDDTGPVPGFLADRQRAGAIRAGYVGAIAEWFDTDLLAQVAGENPDFDIHLCGPLGAAPPARLAGLANVALHGEIPYAEVPAFLKAMDVLIIPFRPGPAVQARDPVKFYEYAAVGRPIVSTALPELARAGDLVVTATDAAGFAKGIRAAAETAKNPAKAAALRAYALENAWSYRAADLLAEMERAPRLSVVLPTSGPAEPVLACLRSLLGRGAVYPALEVLVVDNGSPLIEVEKLRDAAARLPRVRLIENGEDLGFARSCNIGIAAARGACLMLLSKDSHVPPGALSAMVRHLERNPEIGIISPLVSMIGGKAGLAQDAADLAAIDRTARDLVTGYRGMWRPSPVSPDFCAMFRRADLDRIGPLPIINGSFAWGDHCARFRAAGMEIAQAEDAVIHHISPALLGESDAAGANARAEADKAIFADRPESTLPDRP